MGIGTILAPQSKLRAVLATGLAWLLAPLLLVGLVIFIPFALLGMAIEAFSGTPQDGWNRGVHQGRYRRED